MDVYIIKEDGKKIKLTEEEIKEILKNQSEVTDNGWEFCGNT